MRSMAWVGAVFLAACGSETSASGDGGGDAIGRADARAPDAVVTPDAMAVDAAVPDAARPAADAPVLFRFPIDAADRPHIERHPIFGVDHDPTVYDGAERSHCLNYQGQSFPWCYDQHEGSDFLLAGGFRAMDAGSAHVVAAAGGTVIRVEDGNYDRCHANIATGDVDCDGHLQIANRVYIRHANGWESEYYHLKNGSIVVHVGQRVECGEFLALVGSSGNSSAPHLHFEVHGPDGALWDPFAGPKSQDLSLWAKQENGDGLPGDVCDAAWTAP